MVCSIESAGKRWRISTSSVSVTVTPSFAISNSQCFQDQVAHLILDEIRKRLRFLVEVGLEYLTLDRQSRTLSGGELERVDLTTAIGSSLVNTLYILDEPSIGLHPRDSHRLVRILKGLT